MRFKPASLYIQEPLVGLVPNVEIFAKVPYLHLYSDTGCWDEES